MITSNVIQRTFRLKIGECTGTCFTIDVDGRQYVVTAKHVCPDLCSQGFVEVLFDGEWQVLPVDLVGMHDDPVDIAVFAAEVQLSRAYPLLPTSEGAILGQDVYFLGFPYGLGLDAGTVNRLFPVPFVKKAALSSITSGPIQMLFLDGHNNPGFSGGPVVFQLPGQAEFRVAAVICGYRIDTQPVYEGDQTTTYVFRENTGIVVSYSIKHALDIIQSNPIGLPLEAT